MIEGVNLTPISGVLLLFVMLFCGRQFRTNWKQQDDGWKRRAWMYGVPVLVSFLVLAFVPLDIG